MPNEPAVVVKYQGRLLAGKERLQQLNNNNNNNENNIASKELAALLRSQRHTLTIGATIHGFKRVKRCVTKEIAQAWE